MRKPLLHTKVTVKLRKSIFREEWYLYIESTLYTILAVQSLRESLKQSTVPSPLPSGI